MSSLGSYGKKIVFSRMRWNSEPYPLSRSSAWRSAWKPFVKRFVLFKKQNFVLFGHATFEEKQFFYYTKPSFFANKKPVRDEQQEIQNHINEYERRERWLPEQLATCRLAAHSGLSEGAIEAWYCSLSSSTVDLAQDKGRRPQTVGQCKTHLTTLRLQLAIIPIALPWPNVVRCMMLQEMNFQCVPAAMVALTALQ